MYCSSLFIICIHFIHTPFQPLLLIQIIKGNKITQITLMARILFQSAIYYMRDSRKPFLHIKSKQIHYLILHNIKPSDNELKFLISTLHKLHYNMLRAEGYRSTVQKLPLFKSSNEHQINHTRVCKRLSVFKMRVHLRNSNCEFWDLRHRTSAK